MLVNTNVVNRPTEGVGRGYSLTGHHELMIPLLAAMLVEAGGLKEKKNAVLSPPHPRRSSGTESRRR